MKNAQKQNNTTVNNEKKNKKITETEKEIREISKILKETARKQNSACYGCEKYCENIDRYKFAAMSLVEAGFCIESQLTQKVFDDFSRYVGKLKKESDERIPDDEYYEGASSVFSKIKRRFEDFVKYFDRADLYSSEWDCYWRSVIGKEPDIQNMAKIIYSAFTNMPLFCNGSYRQTESFADCEKIAKAVFLAGIGNKHTFLLFFFKTVKTIIEGSSSFGLDVDKIEDDYDDDDYVYGSVCTGRDIMRVVVETEKKLQKTNDTDLFKLESFTKDVCGCDSFVESEKVIKQLHELGYYKKNEVVEEVYAELLKLLESRGSHSSLNSQQIINLREDYRREIERKKRKMQLEEE